VAKFTICGTLTFGKLTIPKVSLYSSVSSAARKRALQTIFDELGAKTFRERRAIIRELYVQLSVFVMSCRSRSPSIKEFNTWIADVQSHTRALSELLNAMPQGMISELLGTPDRELVVKALRRDKLAELTSHLRRLEEITKRRLPSRRGPKKTPFGPATRCQVSLLNKMYVAHTGKQGGAGRRRDHHKESEDHGRPSGPFFRFVKATFALVGDLQGDEAIFRAISHHRAEVKLEELAEQVNREIGDGLTAVFKTKHESGEAFSRALKVHKELAKKLIADAKAKEGRLLKRMRT
jgi:hypothetical protein